MDMNLQQYDEKYNLAYTVTEADEAFKILEILKRRLGMSVRLMRRLKQGGGVFCNGVPARMKDRARAGDLLAVVFPGESSGFEPENIPIRVVYEDADLLIVDKQAGLVVHPTKGHPAHTMANGVMRYMLDRGETYKIRFINRLDMDTTGLLVVGKNAYSQEEFARQSAAGRVRKCYTAVVTGVPEADEGLIDLPIGKAADDSPRRCVCADGFPSLTRYRVLSRFNGYSLVNLELCTGRTHQIRVHMAHIGHALVGDALYGEPAPRLIGRQALHAAELAFEHPAAKTPLRVCAPLPEDMERLIRELRLASG
jgi:23S rRNA pseudouridine1911/1915/1917 synthase